MTGNKVIFVADGGIDDCDGKLLGGDKLFFPFSCWQGANSKTSKCYFTIVTKNIYFNIPS